MRKRLALVTLTWLAVLMLASAAWAAGEVGSTLEFSASSIEGPALRLADFRGRVVLLDFFATWCRPCKEGIPRLNEFQRKYGQDGLSVIGYAVDKGGMAVVKPWAVRNNMEFAVALGDMDVAKSWGVKVLPTTLVIDPQGRVVERFEGVTEEGRMAAAFDKYLSKNAPAAPASAKVNLAQHKHNRIHHFNFYDNEVVAGNKGMVVVVNADLTDQVVEQGLWLQLNLQPLNSAGKAQGEVKPLFQRVDQAIKEQHIMFIRCDQLPSLPEGGRYRAWISILDAKQKQVERSWDATVPRPCGGGPRGLLTTAVSPGPDNAGEGQPAPEKPAPAAQVRVQVPPPAEKPAEIAGIRLAPQEAPPADLPPRKAGEPRVRRVWISDNQVLSGHRGMIVHVLADLKGLKHDKDLWLELSLTPEARTGSGLSPVAEAKVFRQQAALDKDYFPLFVSCDQLPGVPASGVYRTRVVISDGKPQPLERSGDMLIPRPCQTASQTR